MILFLVSHTTEDGDDASLLVLANNVGEVAPVWCDYFGTEDEVPQFIFKVAAPVSPVAYHGKPKALEFHGVHLPRVGGSAPASPR